MVQRYKFSDEYGCHVENDCGDLVTYEDYQKLEAELEAVRQQVKAPADDGWVEWYGRCGRCGALDQPVIGMVEVKLRNESTGKGAACDWCWHHDNEPYDIIAYRVIRVIGN